MNGYVHRDVQILLAGDHPYAGSYAHPVGTDAQHVHSIMVAGVRMWHVCLMASDRHVFATYAQMKLSVGKGAVRGDNDPHFEDGWPDLPVSDLL